MAKKKKASASKKAAPKKKASAKKSAKRPTKVIDVPLKTVYYKQGELIDGFEILEEASARTKKKDPIPFDISWETDDATITLHILGGVTLEKKKR